MRFYKEKHYRDYYGTTATITYLTSGRWRVIFHFDKGYPKSQIFETFKGAKLALDEYGYGWREVPSC